MATIEGVDAVIRQLQSLPFPMTPEDDDLAAILTDMSVLSGQLEALLARAGRGEDVFPDQVPDSRAIVNRLNTLHTIGPEDVSSYMQVVEYLEALQRIRELLLKRPNA